MRELIGWSGECNRVYIQVLLYSVLLCFFGIDLWLSNVEFTRGALKIHGSLCHLFIGEDTSCGESVLLPFLPRHKSQ